MYDLQVHEWFWMSDDKITEELEKQKEIIEC